MDLNWLNRQAPIHHLLIRHWLKQLLVNPSLRTTKINRIIRFQSPFPNVVHLGTSWVKNIPVSLYGGGPARDVGTYLLNQRRLYRIPLTLFNFNDLSQQFKRHPHLQRNVKLLQTQPTSTNGFVICSILSNHSDISKWSETWSLSFISLVRLKLLGNEV
jgi:hypothetical protein